jgi:hypothetical protein
LGVELEVGGTGEVPDPWKTRGSGAERKRIQRAREAISRELGAKRKRIQRAREAISRELGAKGLWAPGPCMCGS